MPLSVYRVHNILHALCPQCRQFQPSILTLIMFVNVVVRIIVPYSFIEYTVNHQQIQFYYLLWFFNRSFLPRRLVKYCNASFHRTQSQNVEGYDEGVWHCRQKNYSRTTLRHIQGQPSTAIFGVPLQIWLVIQTHHHCRCCQSVRCYAYSSC